MHHSLFNTVLRAKQVPAATHVISLGHRKLHSRALHMSARLESTEHSKGLKTDSNQPTTHAQTSTGEPTTKTNTRSASSTQEHKTGDDHPARQPDPQEKPTRSTGIGGQGGVKGGKEGLGARSDK